MSGSTKHEWKTLSKMWPSSEPNHFVVDLDEAEDHCAKADAEVKMLKKHCEHLSKRVKMLKKMFADAQGIAKAWMDLATKSHKSGLQYEVESYNASLKQASLATKKAHQNMNEMIAQLEAEGVVVGSSASHAFDGAKYGVAFLDETAKLYDEHGIKIEAPTWPMPYAPKEALPRWKPDAATLSAVAGDDYSVSKLPASKLPASKLPASKLPASSIPYAEFTSSNMAQVADGKSFCQYDPEEKKLRVFVLTDPVCKTGDVVVCGGIVDEEHAKVAHKALELIASQHHQLVASKFNPFTQKPVLQRFSQWCHGAQIKVELAASNVTSAALWEAPFEANPMDAVVKMIYNDGPKPPKHGTWIHYDAFFGTLTLHAEDSSGVCFEHWATQCSSKSRAAEAAQKLKQLLYEYNEHAAVTLFKKWWSNANGV